MKVSLSSQIAKHGESNIKTTAAKFDLGSLGFPRRLRLSVSGKLNYAVTTRVRHFFGENRCTAFKVLDLLRKILPEKYCHRVSSSIVPADKLLADDKSISQPLGSSWIS